MRLPRGEIPHIKIGKTILIPRWTPNDLLFSSQNGQDITNKDQDLICKLNKVALINNCNSSGPPGQPDLIFE